jgi:putative transposase
MPWKETCVMDERTKFIAEWLQREGSVVELCERHGISRKTGYKWIGRYEAGAGLKDRSRAPHRPGNGLEEEIIEAIVDLRMDRPSWGPRKLKARLERLWPDAVWPAQHDRRAVGARGADPQSPAPALGDRAGAAFLGGVGPQ